ncbi:MAG TPA: diaminopropionate ammonia-lyase [Acidimicrobiales bacterium]|nr:diaminopropionate ammonia-lyase [Acidimicrobiales bacterium]
MLLVNHETKPLPASARPGPEVHAFHRRLPGYAPTPVHDMPALAEAAGVARVLVKDESSRMGLPAFKILGASWATYRVLCDRLAAAGLEGEPLWDTLPDLAAMVARQLGPLRLVAATDGNHGRAVARMAKLLGLSATILVPDGTAPARVGGIAAEGAEVTVVPGTYDDAVAESAALASDRDLVISDTSWPGYEDPPRRVIEGYATIFAELEEQLTTLDAVPDLVMVPLGVGALGAAAASCLRAGLEPGEGPMLVGVEPDSAACVAEGVRAGHVVEVPGPHRSIMAGLNCGLASILALPTVAAGFDAFVTIDDDRCREAMRSLAAAGLDLGETGAAALGGLMALRADHGAELPVPAAAVVLLLATEGVTDPVNFERIVGRPPR